MKKHTPSYSNLSMPLIKFQENLNQIFIRYFDFDYNLRIEIGNVNEIHFGPLIFRRVFADDKKNDKTFIVLANLSYSLNNNELMLFPERKEFINSELNHYIGKDYECKNIYLKIINKFTCDKFNKGEFYNEVGSIYKAFYNDILSLLKNEIYSLIKLDSESRIHNKKKLDWSEILKLFLIEGNITYSTKTRNLSGDHDYDFDHIFKTNFKLLKEDKSSNNEINNFFNLIDSINPIYRYTEVDRLKSEIDFVEGKDYIKKYYSIFFTSYFYRTILHINEIEERNEKLKEIYQSCPK